LDAVLPCPVSHLPDPDPAGLRGRMENAEPPGFAFLPGAVV